VERRAERRQEEHVGGSSFAPRHAGERLASLLTEETSNQFTAARAIRIASSIGREGEDRRRIGQVLTPEAGLLLEPVARPAFPLPRRIVAVPHGQRLQGAAMIGSPKLLEEP